METEELDCSVDVGQDWTLRMEELRTNAFFQSTCLTDSIGSPTSFPPAATCDQITEERKIVKILH